MQYVPAGVQTAGRVDREAIALIVAENTEVYTLYISTNTK